MTGQRDKGAHSIGELRELSSIPAFRKWLDG
jgi:hypothetical protein